MKKYLLIVVCCSPDWRFLRVKYVLGYIISDSGDNGDIEYNWVDTSGVGSLYNSLNSNGAIILRADPTTEMSYGDTYRFLVTARDQGSPPLSSTTTVDVVYRVSMLQTELEKTQSTLVISKSKGPSETL